MEYILYFFGNYLDGVRNMHLRASHQSHPFRNSVEQCNHHANKNSSDGSLTNIISHN